MMPDTGQTFSFEQYFLLQSHDALDYTEVDPEGRAEEEAYIANRRRLLGPSADVTHDDFPRPNRPDENYSLLYDIHQGELRVKHNEAGQKFFFQDVVVIEYTCDHKSRLVDIREV